MTLPNFVLSLIGVVQLACSGASAEPAPLIVGGVPVGEILDRLGAEMEGGVGREQLRGYQAHFDLVDLDGDGAHSKVEYIDKGKYMTPQARRGIFSAADSDGDGKVSKPEYVLNRIITDEGKAIMGAMDEDGDGQIGLDEFCSHAQEKLGGENLAKQVFGALDSDGSGATRVPEYLRVWGRWARAGLPPAAKRLEALNSIAAGNKAGVQSTGPVASDGDGERARRSPPSIDAVFGRFDKNGDGKLGATEIPEFAKKFLLPADADADGSITREELKAHRKNRVPKAGGNAPPQITRSPRL